MSYANLQNLIDRYGILRLTELTDRASTPSFVVDTTIAEQALADATALIDAYIGVRYVLPLDPIPASLIGPACAIAYFRLHRDRWTEGARLSHDDALNFLKDVANGRAVLDGLARPLNPMGTPS